MRRAAKGMCCWCGLVALAAVLCQGPTACSDSSPEEADSGGPREEVEPPTTDARGQDSPGPDGAGAPDSAPDGAPSPDAAAPDQPTSPDVPAQADLPPEQDVPGDSTGPEVISGCSVAQCPAGSACKEDVWGKAMCIAAGLVVEEFDDQAFMAPETTAAWGGGMLTPSADNFSGDGADGEFHPAGDLVVNTAVNGGLFQHSSYVIGPGVTVTVVGPNPYVVKVTGEVSIHGWLKADGQPGLNACATLSGPPAPQGGIALEGGAPGPGAGAGGKSGAGFGQAGEAGAGPGGGQGSSAGNSIFCAGAGGGSFGSAGTPGTTFGGPAQPGTPGAPYGTAGLDPLLSGSGGGGGGGDDSNSSGTLDGTDRPGGSGGGGGGAVSINAAGNITVSGAISADGGQGGWGDFSGGGGGGSGGAILLRSLANVTLEAGVLSVRGGKGGKITNSNQLAGIEGGDGGDGIVRIESQSEISSFVMNPDPPPSFGFLALEPDGGTGADGDFEPADDVVLDTAHGPYHFATFSVPDGVTVTAVGDQPLIIHAQVGMNIEGTIDVSGGSGGPGYSACCGNPYGNAGGGEGGAAGPGGYPGGHGGEAGPGLPGEGPGGAAGGPPGTFSSAGGAGFAAPGQNGGTNQCNEVSGPPGGASYGDPLLTNFEGGSGGGGAGDASAAACIWCKAHQCIVANDISMKQCPSNPAPCDYCVNVPSACVTVGECAPTEKWNPGSGGGGGGGALRLETAGQFFASGTLLLNGGDGGDNVGSGAFNDGTCGPACDKGCFNGQCGPTNGGSFGGSGGGGSGGALLIRAHSVRTLGWISAVGGEPGTLSQGGGCPEDPNAEVPIPGQGRGGRGGPGRIRIETDGEMGSVLAGDGIFSSDKVLSSTGAFAASAWYPLPAETAQVVGAEIQGILEADLFEYQVTPNVGGSPDEAQAGQWLPGAAKSPPAGFVRFRLTFNLPPPPAEPSIVESVKFATEHEVPQAP